MGTLVITDASAGEAQRGDLIAAFDEIEAWANGGISTANLSATAGILLSQLGQSSATTGQIARWNGSAWAAFSPPICHVYTGATNTILSGTPAVLLFSNELTDEDAAGAMHSTSSDTSRITVQTTGYYVPTTNIMWNAVSGAVTWTVKFLKNGSAISSEQGMLWTTPTLSNWAISYSIPPLSLTATDYVEVQASQSSGSSRDIAVASFSLHWVR